MADDFDPSMFERDLGELAAEIAERERQRRAQARQQDANGADPYHADHDEALRQLRVDIGQLNAESPPEHVTAIVDRIDACVPDEIVRDALLKTVKQQTGTPVSAMRKHLDHTAKNARKKSSGRSWQDGLSHNRDGEPYATASNVLIALCNAPQWQGVLALDEFHQRPMLAKKPPWASDDWKGARAFSDADEARTLVWMQENGMPLCRIEAVRQALAVAIDDNRFHPVRDYLDKLVWDKTPRLHKWLTFYLGVAPIENYTAPAGKCWMISAVARIYEPGCQAKYCLSLEGDQDLGKSAALEVLGGEWYSDDIAELGTKDSAMQAGNAWIIEVAEFDSVRKAHVAAVKAFISRKVDRFRKPFGRNVIEQQRQCIMAVSINPNGAYFVDETGNVRFWPVLCTKIDLATLRHDRDQLWAEAVQRYRNGEKWWLEDDDAIDAARQQQDDRQQTDSWEDAVKKYLDERPGTVAITITQVLKNALHIDLKDHDRAKQTRVGIIMKKLKWRARREEFHRWWERPDASDTKYPDLGD